VRYGAEPRSAVGRLQEIPARWPLLFVALSLVALAIVPALLGHRIATGEENISRVLDPARVLSVELALAHSGQMSRLQGYLITGDPGYRDGYAELREREEVLFAALRERLRDTDIGVRRHLATLETAASQWQVNHRFALDDEAQRLLYLESISEDQRRYDALLAAEQALTAALTAEVDAARERMDRARGAQVSLTVALAGLALLATFAVGKIGGRLRSLVRETEQRRAEALRARREMEAVLEATGDGVLGVDLHGRCATLNETGSRLLGIPEVDAVGRDVHELLHGRARDAGAHAAEACPVLEAFRSETMTQEMEGVVWRRDGSAFPARLHLRPLRDGRVVRGAVLTLSDMTDIRTVEAALRQAVHDRDQMVAVVSHDLRNPLGTISAAAELVLDLDLPAEKRDEQLHIVRRSSIRMARLIEDLLDVSRIEAGGIAVEPQSVEVDALVREAVELHELQARERDLHLVSDVEPGIPSALCDHERTLQILFNLLGNALKHTPPGGRVTVSARPEPAGCVTISVADTGEGIAPDDVPRIFDRFCQLRSRQGRSGVGLGLAIVKGLVEAQGGQVWVESEVGKGSVFHFTLPVAGGEPADADDSTAGTDEGALPRASEAGA
jgi:PAS domain S-box-containing protein